MKKIILFGLAVLLVVTASESCKKKKDGNEGGCGETAIKASTIPTSGTVDPPAPGTSFPVIVNIDNMPATGVTIVVNAKAESGGAPFFTETRENVSLTSNHFMINSTPPGVQCIVEVTVSSTTCNTNKWTGSYRYSGK